MKILRRIAFLPFVTILALGQSVCQSKMASTPKEPEALVNSLYKEVVSHHPLGIPKGAGMKIFAPYLSKPLLHRIDIALACFNDFIKRYPDPNLKPPFGWLESGLFSGDDERCSPGDFQIVKARSEKDGTFRVHVKLTREEAPAFKLIWQVTVIVVQEKGQYLVDDVIYLNDEDPEDVESRLSKYLAQGCNGPRWVGSSD
jgi:hypothetical protein